MHLLIDTDWLMADPARHGLHGPTDSVLMTILKGWQEAPPDGRAPDAAEPEWLDLNTPLEQLWANAASLRAADGLLPWAAWVARQDGLMTPPPAHPGSGLGLLTPVHWQVGADRVTLIGPEALDLDEQDRADLHEVLAASLQAAGWALHRGRRHWFVSADELAALPTASLGRVISRAIDPWLPNQPEARRLRRLQLEVQMALHDHPMNERRETRRQLPVNSFWLSGTGAMPEPDRIEPNDLVIAAPGLPGPDLAEQLQTLLNAAAQQRPARLTLCGASRTLTLTPPAPPSWLRRQLEPLQRWRARPDAAALRQIQRRWLERLSQL